MANKGKGKDKDNVTILLIPNYDHIFFTHRSDPIALNSSYMTYLFQAQSAQSPFRLFFSRLLSFTVDLLISAYTAYWSTWSVRQTH